jgi:hypothetical protein
MSERVRGGGSRFLYEPFDAAGARIEANERVTEERWNGLERRLLTIDTTLERLERRLWLALYGVAGFVLLRGVFALLEMVRN